MNESAWFTSQCSRMTYVQFKNQVKQVTFSKGSSCLYAWKKHNHMDGLPEALAVLATGESLKGLENMWFTLFPVVFSYSIPILMNL